MNKKKLLVIIMALNIFIFAGLIQPKKEAEAALQFAIPVGAGAFALGAVAVAGAATLLGNEELARSAGNMAQKTWETVDEATRSAVQAVSQWIPKDSYAPDLKIDYGALSEDVATTLKYRGTGLAYTTASMADAKNIDANSESVEKWNVEGTSITTKYPDASATYNSYRMTLNMNTSTTGKYFFLTSASGSVWYSEQILVQKSGGIYQNFTLTGDKLNARNPLQYYSNMTIGSNFNIAPSVLENPYGTIEFVLEKLNKALGGQYTVGIVSSALVQDIRENAYGNTIESSYTEAWETQKDAGLVIGGQAILDANPGVSWDGTKYVDQTGTAVDTGTLVIPNPTTYTDEAGNIRVGVPTADGTIALDGTTVGTGTGTGEGVGTGETSGILQGLWDWLKGILQSILDAIKAIPGALTGLLQGIIDAVKAVAGAVVSGLSGLLQGVIDAINAVKAFLGTMAAAIADAIAAIFIPPAGYFQDYWNAIKAKWDTKMPIIGQIAAFLGAIQDVVVSPQVPEFKINLGDLYGGGTYKWLDVSFFTDYKTLIVNFIRFVAWFIFLKRLYARIPRMIGE